MAEPPVDVDALVAELQERVEQRRREGVYPPGLEHDLDEHFRRIADNRVIPPMATLVRALAELDARSRFGADRIPTESGSSAGTAVHRVVARAVSRQTQGILEQVQEFADGVRAVLRDVVTALEDPAGHDHRDLVGQVDALVERIAELERSVAPGDATLEGLVRRIEALEAAEAARQPR